MRKSTLPRFNKNNVKEALGMKFRFYDEEDNKWSVCFVAAVDMNKGLTLKDLNNNDPNAFVYCHNLEWFDTQNKNYLLKEAKDCVVSVLNHIYINGETTFNTLMLNFDTHNEWKNLWTDDVQGSVVCPF